VGVKISFLFFIDLSIIFTISASDGRVESARLSETFCSYPNNVYGM
jgi:hypothetical protein